MDTPQEYVGERLWLGNIGHFSLVLAIGMAALAVFAYSRSTNKEQLGEPSPWRNLGRIAFGLHGLGILTAIALIFHMMIQRYYEYEYAFGHVSDDLPFQYIFSAFWEGQEGSFLLWMFWNVVLGGILMKTAKEWEAPVLAIFALVQVFLLSMVLGIYITENDARLGSSPFALLRDTNLAPIFNDENYLSKIKGNGLNPLLQNYWMTIHPPTLFLGFASTLVPFAYAIAGWWRRQYREWLRPVLPWSLFSAAVLGTGIAMGGAWAYEALSFGGYWAWDPVENASLVPWIILVAGIHTALVARNTDYSIRSTYWFYCFTFILVVYSTFLTRSGILGETSVHAFTEMGLEWQLIAFMAILTALPIAFVLLRRKQIPVPEKEETAYSREFWMFVGALVLTLSAALITFTTSIPVFNKVLGTEIAPPDDVVAHHNQYQLWTASLMAVLSGFAQFLRYKMQPANTQKFFSRLTIHVVVSLALAVLMMTLSGIGVWQYWILVACGTYTVVSNADYLVSVLRGKIKVAGSAVAHIGFGVLMLGVVFSGALKTAISETFGSDQLTGLLEGLNKQTNKNVVLPKGQTIPIADGYSVTYKKSWEEGNGQHYELEFVKRDKQGNEMDKFTTNPYVLLKKLPNGNNKLLAANPNTQHYLSKDVFTLAVPHWAFDDPEKETEKEDWKKHKIAIGDTFYTSQHYVVFKGFDNQMPSHPQYQPQAGDIPVTALLNIHTVDSDSFWQARPLYFIRGNMQYDLPFEVKELGLSFRLSQMLPDEKKMQIEVLDKNSREYVVLQALIFPGINLVWIGCIMMMLGLLMGMWQKRGR